MKAIVSLFSHRRFRLNLFFLSLGLLAVPMANAGLTVNMLIYHTVPGLSASGGYQILPILSTNTTPPNAPLGHYLVSSPGSLSHSEYDLTSSNFTGGSFGNSYPDFNSFIQQLTNGNWTIGLTNNSSSNLFAFAVNAHGLNSNAFAAAVVVTFPTNSQVNVTNRPVFTWQAPSSWAGDLSVEDYNSDDSFFQSADLPPAQTSWAIPATLPDGDHTFGVFYNSNATPVIVASTPTNINTGSPISGWVPTATLQTYEFIPFSVSSPSQGGGGGSGGVITGNMVNQPDYQTYTITDGSHSAQFLWSQSSPGSTAWIYGTFNTSVALAAGITNVTQITNAAIYAPFSTSSIGPVSDAGANGGIGQFVVLQSTSGYYAVVRIDDVQDNDTLNATWWFQTNGTGDFSDFVGPATLSDALDATNLTWTTSGDTSWFVETTNSYDGVSAAQSGSVTNFQTSVLQTTVTGPGTLTFWWSTQTPPDDYDFDLEFSMDDTYLDIYNVQPWIQETVNIPAGQHTLTWTAYAGDYASDAGFLDQVSFTPATLTTVLQSAEFRPILVNDQSVLTPGGGYWVEPYLFQVQPEPLTVDEIASPNGHFTYFHTNEITAGALHHDLMPSWAAVANECTNGLWTLYVNKGDPSEKQFQFSVTLSGLDTNLLKPVTVLIPAAGSVNVATNTPITWSVPDSSNGYIGVDILQPPPFTYLYSDSTFSATATNWIPTGPLNYGTNFAEVEIFYSAPAIVVSVPTNAAFDVISNWTVSSQVETRSSDSFVVGAPAPLPVQLGAPPQHLTNGNFQLGFQTVAGRPETIQMRTNLTLGPWTDLTNFIGNGSSQQFTFPATNPGEYFRVITQ